ncbi:fibrinogen-like protein A [Physella acuta]|uniref:fibrinogen-like protein A n=1 Tax=Physella acuta TaxID=109671 RepID=UPI0027DD8177|nr:fibrinogen-like protein A [Physella acuta]
MTWPQPAPLPTLKHTRYKKLDDRGVAMLPINREFDQVSHLSCASLCTTSRKRCYSYIYNTTTRHCSLGSWLFPLKSSDQTSQGKIYSTGKFCNTTRNITVLPDLSVLPSDLAFCLESCRDLDSSDPRPIVTLKSGLQVMCDTVTDGGGWTIFQRRVSGTVDFYRNWTEYKNGFGNFISGNFYLGNENIYLITSQIQHELRVDLTIDGKNFFAKYSNFSISSETNGYRLMVSGYNGTASDGLNYHNNMMFTTYDRDNDKYDGNCAVAFHGAWWYLFCYYSNLNGLWGDTGDMGTHWVKGQYTSITFTEMKIRSV